MIIVSNFFLSTSSLYGLKAQLLQTDQIYYYNITKPKQSPIKTVDRH